MLLYFFILFKKKINFIYFTNKFLFFNIIKELYFYLFTH